MNRYRAEVREYAQRSAKRQEAGFGLEVSRSVVEGRITDGAEQHGVSLADGGTGNLRERVAVLGDPSGAYGILLEVANEPESLPGDAQRNKCRRDDFRPDPVTGEDCDLVPSHSSCRAKSAVRRRS